MPETELITLIAVGMVAGTLGGLLGIGGSILMIPVLTLVFDHDQHLSQAVAMIVNVFVAVPAVLRHHRAGAVDWTIARRMLPAGIAAIFIGVLVSNRLPGEMLMRVFGVFLIYVIFVNVRKLLEPGRSGDGENRRQGWAPAGMVGAITGFAAGLLGIGGGIIAVPLLQRVCRLPLRRCIACSTAFMCVTASVGATSKNLTLHQLSDASGAPLDAGQSLLIAACLAPTAVLGGLLGAGFTHSLPLRWLRLFFVVLLTLACAKFLGLL